MNKYYPFIDQNRNELTSEMMEALWNFTTNDFPIYNDALTVLPRNVMWKDIDDEIQRFLAASKTSGDLPVPRKLKQSKPKPDTYTDDPNYLVKRFIRKQHKRDVEWLKANGYCQDHIKPGRSTLKQAGRGAFASRDLPVGTIVGFSALIHIGIHGRDIFTVTVPNPDRSRRRQYDLIINYSFGHANSTIILTPYGGMINFINHASERTEQKPNVRLRWPNKELISHKPYYLHRTPLELKYTGEKIGLAFEYVALRDIKKDEEIFIDYGNILQN
jgi:SET domain